MTLAEKGLDLLAVEVFLRVGRETSEQSLTSPIRPGRPLSGVASRVGAT